MTILKAGGIEVDACVGGCGGLWFDAFELRQLDEPEENYGEALVDIDRDESIQVNLDIKRRCPRCETVTLWRHQYAGQAAVLIDECPECGGFFLDAGELGLIRESWKKAAEKRAYTQALLENLKKQSLAGVEFKHSHEHSRSQSFDALSRFFKDSHPEAGK